MSRLNILAIAFACNPTLGSESGVGWGWVNAIAKSNDITVITADFNSVDIGRYCERNEKSLKHNPRFLFVRNRAWHYRPAGIWLKIESSLARPLVNLAYQSWLRYAFVEAKREVETNHYDAVHLITMVGWRFPGDFYRLDVPFVWGPIGGMKNTPWHLLPMLGLSGALHYGGRNIINSLQLKTLKGPRRALRAANNRVIAATAEIQQELWSCFGSKSQVICEVGPPDFTVSDSLLRTEREPFRICWSGTHTPGKALQLLLFAVARLSKKVNYRLDILGDGPRHHAWRSLATRLRIDAYCHWYGQLPRDQALAVMRNSHVFVITSLKDLTSTVAVEAVSLGLPIVCLDHCGFSDLVTEECGIKIGLGSQEQIVSGLANGISSLFQNEALRIQLAEGAIRRGRDYSWNGKMKKLQEIYRSASVPHPAIDVKDHAAIASTNH